MVGMVSGSNVWVPLKVANFISSVIAEACILGTEREAGRLVLERSSMPFMAKAN